MNMKFCLFVVYNFSIDIIVELLINIEVWNIFIFIGLNIFILWKIWEYESKICIIVKEEIIGMNFEFLWMSWVFSFEFMVW